jgi:3',5'-cyclic AMP phosphodiesterase CpdA
LDPYYLTADVPSPDLSGTITDSQLTWLGDQLAKTKATHKFLVIHTPFAYIAQTGTTPDASFTNLWTILDDNKFDIYFCGHEHLYSRKSIDSNTTIYPPRSTPKWKNSVVQLLTGTAGAAPVGGVVVNPNEWHVSNSNDIYYFSVVDINGSNVKVNSYKGYQTASDYTVFDSFTINKGSLSGIELLLE